MQTQQSPAATQFPIGILGNLETLDFELIDLEGPPDTGRNLEFQARGLYFIGAACLVDGRPACRFEVPPDEAAIQKLTAEYTAYIARKILGEDEVAALRWRAAIPDTRVN